MKRNIVKISAILLGLVLAAKVLAFIRDPLVAALFGADNRTDAFFSALTITTILFSFLSPTITASIIPLFVREREANGSAEAWRKMSGVLIAVAGGLLALTGVMVLIAPLIVKLMSPGYSATTQALTVQLVRIMSPLLVAMPLNFFVSTLLNAEKRFYVPGALPFISNAIILAVIFIGYKTLGIKAVAWGTLAGALIQLVIILITARGRLIWSRKIWPGTVMLIRQIGVLGWPVLLAAVIFNANFLVMLHFSSFEAHGTYSFLTYGIRIQQVFLDILFASFATVIFPYLSDLAAPADQAKFRDMSLFGLKFLTMILIPVTILLVVLRVPVVEIIYQRHGTLPALVDGISTALAFFAVSLVAFGVVEIFNRTFYAQKDTRTPLLMTVVGMIVALISYFTIGHTFSGLGLALAYSLGAIATAITGLVFIRRSHPGTVKIYLIFFSQVLIAGVLCGGAAYGTWGLMAAGHATTLGVNVLGLLSAGMVGLVVFGGLLWLLRVEEMSRLIMIIKTRFGLVKPPVGF